jgi:tRNA A-37 threonylcarbamoyl transferase component Bud32/tetratricopeptide (TPR) repeat protein
LDLPSPFAGRYEILRELGHGASAVVYLVHDQQHDRDVALKVLSPDYASALGPARFLREIRLVSRLQHPYIVPVLDSGESDGRLYFVMPLVEGQPLRVRMHREGQLPVADSVRYATEIADALQHAHEHGVLHRDVKPENILLSGHHACLADFGIARALTPATGDEITTTGVILGTPAYMSPEQATSEANIDGRSDQYALACVLFEMLAGIQPFVGASEQSIIAQRFHHPAPRISQYRPSVGRKLEETIARALAMVPADRFSSLGAFAEALRQAMETPSMEELRAVSVSPPDRAQQRRRWVAGAAMVALAGIVSLAAWWKLTGDGEALAAGNLATLISDPGAGIRNDAATAYQRARKHFASGRLDSAELEFERAAVLDPAFALASLWHAQLIQWRADERDGGDWSLPARRAMRNRERLMARDALHANALVALAEHRYPDACSEFDRVVEADSKSFVGWLGQGECRRLDRAVVPDARSPSRWRFRAELSDAIDAYTEALTWVPGEQSAPVLRRALSDVFYTTSGRIRTGRAVLPDSGSFLAYPALAADTISFVPYREAQFTSLDQATAPRSRGDGLQRGRELELGFVRTWVQRMPGNVDALAAYSTSLESTGTLGDENPRTPDALAIIRDARRRARDSRTRVVLQAAEVRLLIKKEQFANAGRLADSALHAEVIPDRAAGSLAALSALQGRELQGRQHLQAFLSTPQGRRSEYGDGVSAALAARSVPLTVAVETGHCDAAYLDSLEKDFKEFAASAEEPADSGGVSARLLDDIRVRATTCTNGASALRLQRIQTSQGALANAAARKDRQRVLAALSQIDAMREGVNRSSLSWDSLALECWALASIGAVEHAAARLDSSLVGLAYSSNRLTTSIRLAGGFRRALELRSALAAQLGDSSTSNRWRDAVEALSLAPERQRRSVSARTAVHPGGGGRG